MNPIAAFFRATLWWLAPLVALLLVIGWQIDWGAGLRRPLPADVPLPPKPLATELLPNYAIEGGLAANAETVDRTLFNPTRRPAPVALAEAAKPRMQKGLYALTGTTIAGERSLAFLKEVKGGKARTVKQGDTVDGMLVAEVTPERVRLALGDESEELRLRVATNPKPTPQPPPPAPAAGGRAAGAPVPPGQPAAQPQPAQAPTATPQGATAAQSLAERRRAARAAETARAAEAAAAGGAATQGANPPAAAEGSWGSMDQRYRRRVQPSGK